MYKRPAIIKFWKHIYLPVDSNVKVKLKSKENGFEEIGTGTE